MWWYAIRSVLGFGIVWSLSSVLAILAWAWTVLTFPGYVVTLKQTSDEIAALVTDAIGSVAPFYAAAFASLPAGSGFMYLSFFVPAYLVTKMAWYAFFDTDRFK